MLNILFPKKPRKDMVRLNNKVQFAFTKLDQDIDTLHKWMIHIHEKSSHLEKNHANHVEITRQDMQNISKWLHFLNSHTIQVKKYFGEMNNIMENLSKRDDEILKELDKLKEDILDVKQGQLRTPERTIEGHVPTSKDMSFKDVPVARYVLSEPKNTLKVKDIYINKGTFTGSQLELIDILYNSDRPLSYSELATITGKQKKSIRNLIYEVRDKGLQIENKFVGLRKKGYYFSESVKVKLSGR